MLQSNPTSSAIAPAPEPDDLTLSTPVLIVGAGPIGLALALELGWRGVPCTLIEQGDGSLEHPRTGLIAVRTMEAFRRWGIAQRIRDCGFPPDYELSMVFCTSLNGLLLDREPYPSMQDTPTPAETPEKKQRCPQLWMQPILADAVREEPQATVRFNHRLANFEQDDEGVTAQVVRSTDGAALTIRSAFVVACDGATSAVREQLGIAMQGRLLSYSVNILIRAPGLTAQHRMGPAERYLFVGPEGTWGNLTVVDADAIWRLTVLGTTQKADMSDFDAEYWVKRALGRDDIAFVILSVQGWRRSEMLAKRFFDGRVVLAGDATHTMSPTGGMGMNTGMQEVLDLGWKLQALIDGWGGPALLESYEAERKPVAQRNIDFSSQNFRAWVDTPDPSAVLQDSLEGERARRAVGQRLRESTRVEWESLGLQIGYRYEHSPIIIPDGTPAAPDDYSIYLPTARPGSRAPHAWLADGRSTLDLFGQHFVLLAFDPIATAASLTLLNHAFHTLGVPFEQHSLSDPSIAALYGMPLVLVRADGHVAWRAASVISHHEAIEIVRIITGNANRASGTTITTGDHHAALEYPSSSH